MKLDKNMGMLLGAIVLIVVTLGGSLVLSIRAMRQVTTGMTAHVIPVEDELSGISDALASSFEWQSRLNATEDRASYDEVVSSRSESDIDDHLQRLKAVLTDAGLNDGSAERLARLDEELLAFREQQAALSSSVGRRHDLNEDFNARVLEVNTELGEFLQALESLQGRVRLDYVYKLAALDAQVDRTTAKAITQGTDRATYDALQDLRPEAVRLGLQLGKIGLTNDLDSLNSIVANEVVPTVGSVTRRLDDIQEFVKDDEAYSAEVRELREEFLRIVDLGSADSEASLRGLRHSILDEFAIASAARDEFQLTASNLSQGAQAVQADAKQMVGSLEDYAVVAMKRSQWTAILAGLVALVAVGIALGRIAQSVRNLRKTNTELVGLKDELEQANAVLESKVQERTEALARREVAVRGLLNGLAEGVLEVSFEGEASDERSSVVAEWFGPQPSGMPASEYLFDVEAQQVAFDVGLEQIAMDILPVEMCIDQMPSRRMLKDGRVLEFDYRMASGGLLVIIQDISSRLEAERAHRETKEFQRLVEQILQDSEGFTRFVEDGTALMSTLINTQQLGVAKLALHTLKGNSAVCGACEVAEACHDLETTLQNATEADQARLPTTEELQVLQGTWERMIDRVAGFAELSGEARVSVLREDIESLVEMLASTDAKASEHLEQWLLEPIEAELLRLGHRASRVAEKIGKTIEVEVDSHGLRTTPGFARKLLGELVHVARNAVDHGIETPDLRLERGKSAKGKLRIEASLDGAKALRLSIADDGGGVNWERLRSIAAERGLPHATHDDLVEVMFSSGVSTAEQVTELSGRGVGTTATKRACEALGGRVEVQSKPGKGTEIAFVIPIPRDTKVVLPLPNRKPVLERAS